MPDTIYYYNSTGQYLTGDSLPPAIKAMVEKDLSEIRKKEYEQQKAKHIVRSDLFQVILIFAILIIAAARVIKVVFDSLCQPQPVDTYTPLQKDASPEPAEYYIYNGAKLGLNREDITSILIKRYPYYNHLTAALKYRFVNRLVAFIRCKNFIIYSKEPLKEMPVLASAAAIQLTFGLDEYLLPWFVYIRIHPEEYFAQDSLRVLAGNVEGKIITLAWNQLLLGINDETDGVNVGLHEMAHALYYQHAEVQGEKTGKFAGHFDEVMEEGEEVYKLKTTQHILFTDYAYHNLQEFWAESVEIFFEKPGEMQHCYPHIYDTLKELLQQNPLNQENPLG